MKQLVLSIILIFSPLLIYAQDTAADKILGEWLNEEKDEKIEIYKSGIHYFGKVTWGTDFLEADGKTSKKDLRNTDETLKARNLINTIILNKFEYNDGTWDNGTMYDPKSGKTYNCIIKLRNNKLEIRGYVGVSLFGRTTYWERLE
ncbi:DUF2147 domain-containing protein [Dyadobacter psychrotolerans]|uniref:DUF2147 domain-containing protein n=1 Tax=Dyadobacter psychrotolerans TaxID=2541721 RepID=A0A4R5DV19_9BACT|nr:DUF2147 domain-containing protein [Dyadobacter psychrotolerans]TDE17647.1 DUF2147 domain-containing protein [Dyadobacter psychrotolerans]